MTHGSDGGEQGPRVPVTPGLFQVMTGAVDVAGPEFLLPLLSTVVLRGENGDDLEVGEVRPARCPLRELLAAVGLHDLEAARRCRVDPARVIGDAIRQQASCALEALTDRPGV